MPQPGEIVNLQIIKIQEIVFIIDERLVNPEKTNIRIKFLHKLEYDITRHLIIFTLRTIYHYEDNEEPIVESQVRNFFITPDKIENNLKDGKVVLPFDACISIVSMAIGHSRALISRNLSGSNLHDSIIPIANPIELAKNFFPESYQIELDIYQNTVKANLKKQIGTNEGFGESIVESSPIKNKKKKLTKAPK